MLTVSKRAMKLTVAKIVMRVIGTLAGLLGLGMLGLAPFIFYHAIAEWNLWMILLAAFPLALAVYLVYVAYLVWFRFSPLAVRHICGALGFYGFTLLTPLFNPGPGGPDTAWSALAFLGCIVGVYLAYRVASNRLSRLLFPESISGVQA